MFNGKKSHVYASSFSEKAGRLNAKMGCIVNLPTGKKYLVCVIKGKRNGSMDVWRQLDLLLAYLYDTDCALMPWSHKIEKVTFTFTEGKM